MSHLHDYRVIANTIEASVEVCKKQGCHLKSVFRRTPDGRHDQRTYQQEHMRDILQPWQKEWHQEYGIKLRSYY